MGNWGSLASVPRGLPMLLRSEDRIVSLRGGSESNSSFTPISSCSRANSPD
eukprot:CAMPEP_0170511532 /NCGR_PEP_ID=MMETSP0208-20121228/66356_1 /TAXON_ID=197538 /ORGANISM="Strombidium inclinatum, Strain S3" /LENGTH=50 /DNA_ID=CAMNT_0010795083 /DNA_START=2042 /DNA_END=2194 /DNA_ORIENTATION=+